MIYFLPQKKRKSFTAGISIRYVFRYFFLNLEILLLLLSSFLPSVEDLDSHTISLQALSAPLHLA